MSTRSLVEEVASNRAIEAKLAELKAEQDRLMKLVSAPRAAILREMELAAAYRLVLSDVNRLAGRAASVDAGAVSRMSDIAAFLTHRAKAIE